MGGLRKRQLVGRVEIAAGGALPTAALAAGALLVGALLVGVVLRGGVRRYVVSGESMSPTLRPGDSLWVVRTPGNVSPRPGWIVVARRPDRPDLEIIKRVGAGGEGEGLRLVGDNPWASTDSRAFGAVRPEMVVGVAVWRYWPPRRFGWVR